jgi:hypothetical protein
LDLLPFLSGNESFKALARKTSLQVPSRENENFPLLRLFEVFMRREKEDIRRRNSNFMSTFSSLLILEIFRI